MDTATNKNGLLILDKPCLTKIVCSRKNIERIGAKNSSPGPLNQIVFIREKEVLKTKTLRVLLSNNFINKTEIIIDIQKYSNQKKIMRIR